MLYGVAMRGRSERRSKRVFERGYTLLEVLIVLSIIALVAALVGPRLIAQLDRSKATAARVQMRSLVSALETMRLDIGRYPTAEEGLAALTEAPRDQDGMLRWQGPYLETDVPPDPWGRPYLYTPPPTREARPRIVTLGADGQEGGDGITADLASGEPQ
jgi:general secretion pathway protein G